MPVFAVASCHRNEKRPNENIVVPFMVSAANRDEALGKALRVIRSLSPSAEGNYNHEVFVGLPDVVISNPDAAGWQHSGQAAKVTAAGPSEGK